MEDSSVFDKLVSDLNSSERKRLLEKLNDLQDISSEPLKQESDQREAINYALEYRRLNPFRKFIIFLQQIFTGKDPLKLVESMFIRRFTEKIRKQTVGIVNFSSRKFLDGFCKELITLNNHLSKIKEPFQTALETKRKEFFAFFVSVHLEDLQEALNEEIDPYHIYETSPLDEFPAIKEEMSRRFRAVLERITDADRSRLNHHAFSLHYLYRLCEFNFDSVIARFNEPLRGEVGSLPFQVALKEVYRLLDLLQSAMYPPTPEAVETVVLFFHHEQLEDPDIDVDETILTSINRVETAFSAIRKFNRTVPLLNIVRALTRNLNYSTKLIQGGEDWFVLFKSYWEERLNRMYREFLGHTRRNSFFMNTNAFLKLDKFCYLRHYNIEKTDHHHIFQYPHCLGFIAGFCERIFLPSMHGSLNILVLQGSFYKQENRTEFTDAYNHLSGVCTRIRQLDDSLSTSGELGGRMEKVQNEIMKGNLNSSHLDVIIKEVDSAARVIIEDTLYALNSMENILNGVLFARVGSKYDSVSNLRRIGGKNNSEFQASLKISLSFVQRANELLKEIISLEGR